MKSGTTTGTIAFPAFKMVVESGDPAFAPPTSTVLVHPSTNVDKIRLAFTGRAAEDYDVWVDDGTGSTRLSLEAGKTYIVTAKVTAHAILFEVQVSSWKDAGHEYIHVGS